MGLPLKSDEQNYGTGRSGLIRAMIAAGLYRDEAAAMRHPAKADAAMLLARQPEISLGDIAQVTGMSKAWAMNTRTEIRQAIDDGLLDLAPFVGEAPAPVDVSGLKGIDLTRELIRMQKQTLMADAMAGRMVPGTALKNLVDAEIRLNSAPGVRENLSTDFYDQIFDRVPAGEDPRCEHCARAASVREAEDFEAMGRAGDLAPGEVAVEPEPAEPEAERESETGESESEYAGAWLGPRPTAEQEVGS